MLNVPGWVLAKISPVYSSYLSYLSYGLMIFYFFISKKWSVNKWLLLLGVLYFGISSLSGQLYMPTEIGFIIIIIKYFVVIIGGYAIVQDTSKKDFFFFLLLGASTVFLQIFIFFDPLKDGGRYSGFYLNPNGLGFICMMGYGLTYGLCNKWKTIGQITFTIVGFLTFSRTFILVWLFMNLFSIRLSLKNLRVLAVGIGLFVGLLTFNAFLPKSNPRLMAMSNILEGKSNKTNKLEEGGRTETWALFYPALMDKPLFGNGYDAFGGGGVAGAVGAHNAYLKIIGDAGIFTLLIFLIMFFDLLLKTSRVFLKQPHLALMTFALCLFLLTNHNFFDSGYVLFFTMWLQYQTTIATKERLNSPKMSLIKNKYKPASLKS
ncbi:O-Antigen ligase [Maribacter ulvicola]|uniref:O-Antigen ligase n=2 Tax=Maribacter ulvicola TaxID=228959 RepID=A0A1N6VIQ6_9FLAO|nr:O-Antigen ligase [Maribacter ulvicola]